MSSVDETFSQVSESESRSVVSDSLQPHGLYSPWNSPGQNTGVGSFSLFQGIFPTQGSNPGLSHCRRILYQLSHKGSPRILEWGAYSFSSGLFQSRNWTGVSCITGRFFTNWAIREAIFSGKILLIRAWTFASHPIRFSNTISGIQIPPIQDLWSSKWINLGHPGMWSQVGLRKHHYKQS